MLHYRYLMWLSIYSAKFFLKQLSQTLQVWQQKLTFLGGKRCQSAATLSRRQQNKDYHALGKWMTHKETTAADNNSIVTINQTRFKPNQARPSLTSSAPSKYLWLLAPGMHCGTGGSHSVQYLYTASLQSNPQELGNIVSASFTEKKVPLTESKPVFHLTFVSWGSALPLDVSSNNGYGAASFTQC